MKCSNCGAQIDANSLFCTECGKPIPQGNVCSHCGALVNNGDAFCQNCGNKVDGSSAPNVNFQAQAPYTAGSSSQSNFILPIVIGGIFLVVLILAGGGWWYYKHSNSLKRGDITIVGNAEDGKIYSEKETQEMKKFLEEFYGAMGLWGQFEESHIEENVTANALRILNKYGYECLTCDEGQGGQANLNSVEHIGGNSFKVRIHYYGEGLWTYYEIKLGVIKKGSDYKIDSIERYESVYGGRPIEESNNTTSGNTNSVYMSVFGNIGDSSGATMDMEGSTGYYYTGTDSAKRTLKCESYNPTDGHCVLNAYLSDRYIGKFDGIFTSEEADMGGGETKTIQTYKGTFKSAGGAVLEFYLYVD